MTSTASSSPPPVSISTVTGKFFPNPNNSGTFDVTPSTAPAFTQSFPVIDFNPPSTAQVSCSNSTGVDENTRPFTDVVPQPDGSCTTDAAGSAGTGSLSNFEAEFQANLTVAAAGQVTFNFYSDDGWVLAMGPSNGVQPTYVSGSMVNAPASGPFTGYPIVGSYNQPSSPTQNTVTVNVPAAGTYPIEVDYTECCGGSLALTLGTTYGNPIQSQTITGPGKLEINSFSEHKTTCNTARPINCATGAFWHTLDDLAVPGRGMALDIAQTYDSLNAAQNSPLGFGWTDSYNMYLSADSSGNTTVHEETGTAVPFTCGSSSCTPPSRVLATLVENSDGTYTFTRDQTQQQFIFAAPSQGGDLLKEVDRNGYTTTLTYSNGQLASVTDPEGRSLMFAYNAANQIASITDPANRTVSFSYDAAGNLSTVTDVAGGVTKFTYDSNHLLLTMTDPNGGVTTNVYDAQGRVTQQTDPMGRKTTLSYTANADGSQTTTITDPNGNIETQTYQNNELLKDTLGSGTPQAATWKYTYDPATLGTASVTDPDGHASTNTWDAQGNVLSSTDALNHTTTYTYDNMNDVTSATDPNNVTTTLSYDSHGNLLSIARPLTSTGQTSTTSFSYGDSSHPGDITAVTDPNGHTTTIAYDANGDVTKVTDALGNITTGSYDGIGRLTSVVSPKGNVSGATPASYTTSLTYNPFGDVLTSTDPLGHKTSYQYDADQNLTSVTDPSGHVTAYTYDADNESTGVARANGSTLGYSYDGDGNLLGQTNGANQTTSYAYNPLDRVVSMTDPLNRTTTYTYDGTGNLTSLVDAMGRTTTYAYDAANELTGVSYSDGSTPNVSYTYDKDGQRLSMTDGTGTSSYSYDSLNRLTQSKDGAGKSVSYGYDLAGNLTALTYPNGSQVTRTYDAANHLASVKDWLGHTTSFAYDPNSNLTTQSYPNTTSAAFTYDAANQLNQIVDSKVGSTFASFAYTRDNNGQVTSTTQTGVSQGNQSYSYTSLNQLASANGASYTYDAADNVTQLASGAGLSYDAAGELKSVTQGSATTSYAYDANGNRTSVTPPTAGPTTYTYDQANRLTQASVSGGQAQGLVAAGWFHSLAVKSDGTVWAWGENNFGQLGNGTTSTSATSTPGQVSGLSNTAAVAANGYFSMALKRDGTVWDWGDNGDGQLGNGTTTNSSTPVQVSSLTGVTRIAAGCDHSLALKSDGTVWAWGYNRYGQVGNGTTTNSSTPVQVSGLSNVIAVAAGCEHSLALKSDGTVWGWGYNADGELGNGGRSNSSTPVEVSNLSGITSIAAGKYHSLAVKNDGTAWAWGYNNYGQLGNGTTTKSNVPVQVSTLSNVQTLAGGNAHSLAITTSGAVYAWGDNGYGQLGNGTTTSSSTPVQVSSLTNGAAIAAGADHSIAATGTGTAWDWGNNQYGQLGNGNTSNASTPIQVSSLSSIQSQTNASYTYNGDGLRMSKTVNGTAEAFSWDLAEGLPLMLQDGGTQFVDGPGGMPIEQVSSSGTVTYLYQDQLGSTRVLADSSGTVVGTYSYDAFGTTTSHTGTASTPLQYAGQYFDNETSLYYLQARYYDPSTAQFINVDPLANETGQPYSYANSNPLNEVDPTGLCGNCNAGAQTLEWITKHAGTIALIGAAVVLIVAVVFGPELLATVVGVAGVAAAIVSLVSDIREGKWPAAALDLVSLLLGGASFKLLEYAGEFASEVSELVDAYRASRLEKFAWEAYYKLGTKDWLQKVGIGAAKGSLIGAALAWIAARLEPGLRLPSSC